MTIPQEYVVQKFYTYSGGVKHNGYNHTYQGSCPICREGNSWLKKRRCYFLTKDNVICCHNCGWYSNPVKWIQEVSGQTYKDILNEINIYDVLPIDILQEKDDTVKEKHDHKLPLDCINLFDPMQVEYHKNHHIVKEAITLIQRRKLDTAINRPKSLWVSLTDKVHKNRLVIPFYNTADEIIFYQSRTIIKSNGDKTPKYLSKINGDKSLYNINEITPDLEYIFIFEGPIDAFFVRNGTAVAGIQEKSDKMFSGIQGSQINNLKFHKRIWVLDSQWLDTASKLKTKKLIDNGETVFMWPEKIGKSYKDINDVCIAANIDQISPDFFIRNSYHGLKARLMLSAVV